MKTIVDVINESNINESRFEIDSCNAKGNMKYGFMMYEETSGTVSVIQFNKLSELADFQGFDEEDYMSIDKLKVGETVYDGSSYMYTRIW